MCAHYIAGTALLQMNATTVQLITSKTKLDNARNVMKPVQLAQGQKLISASSAPMLGKMGLWSSPFSIFLLMKIADNPVNHRVIWLGNAMKFAQMAPTWNHLESRVCVQLVIICALPAPDQKLMIAHLVVLLS